MLLQWYNLDYGLMFIKNPIVRKPWYLLKVTNYLQHLITDCTTQVDCDFSTENWTIYIYSDAVNNLKLHHKLLVILGEKTVPEDLCASNNRAQACFQQTGENVSLCLPYFS